MEEKKILENNIQEPVTQPGQMQQPMHPGQMQQPMQPGQMQQPMQPGQMQTGQLQPQTWQPAPPPPYVFPMPKKHENLLTFQRNFPFFGIACAVYALFYTFCLYQNFSGIAMPVLAVGTLVFGYVCLKKVGVPMKKDVWFYAVAITLLGINLCMTKDTFLIFFDYAAMLLLLVSGFLHLCCNDEKWDFSAYLTGIFLSLILPIKELLNPFFDGNAYWKTRRETKGGKGFYIFIGVICGLPLLILVLALLGSADFVFKKFLEAIFIFDLDNGPDGSLFVMLLGSFFVSYAFLSFLFSHEADTPPSKHKKYETVIAITINAMLSVFYLIFSVIQIVYLFLGKFSLPEQYTYAEYAKEGFYQLLAVCIINLVLVLICVTFFEESKALKIMLAVITGCTYIMIASSALRMKMYVEAYELTYLRLNVFWMLLVLTFFFTGILAYIFSKKKFSLFRYAMVVITVLYIGYAFARPETIIASYNLREEELAQWKGIDAYYLSDFSSDAYPIFREVCEREGNEEFAEYFMEEVLKDRSRYARLFEEYEDMDFRTFNFSLYNAFR
ncbi:MAG: DUF4173 domain-containing protein [Lachnospiraceae bacterium]|nr:DUF4173 domain-containing protein [Lachnospiraceae bacterium]